MSEKFSDHEFFREKPEHFTERDKLCLQKFNAAYTSFYPQWKKHKIHDHDATYTQKKTTFLGVSKWFLFGDKVVSQEVKDYIERILRDMELYEELVP